MKDLPPHPHLDHLKKQAKILLAACRAHDSQALARIRASLPAASRQHDPDIFAMALRLHDAQSCIAREYGFASWTLLRDYVGAQALPAVDAGALLDRWRSWAFGAGHRSARPQLAARLLREHPRLLDDRPALACAAGDLARVREQLAGDRAWARLRGAPGAMSPLQCACFSGLIRLPEYAPGIRACAALLLEAGADPHDAWIDPAAPGEPLSPLYAAAGRHHDAGLTRLLLAAGADPNDNESLYHATEAPDSACVRLLLEAGARVTGCNALYRSLDFEHPQTTRLLLAHGGDPNEPSRLGPPLAHAVRRRRSPEVIGLLLAAGADPASANAHGVGAWRLARITGQTEVAAMLREAGAAVQESPRDAFLAACARADRDTVRAMLAQKPGLIAALGQRELRLLPELAATGCDEAVRVMVEAGWPVAVPGGDIRGSALNQAVFRGDSALAAFLLAHGAHYDERHGYDDNVYGTLSFASLAEITPAGDWLGCARALVESGAPLPAERYAFSDEVAAYFEELRNAAA